MLERTLTNVATSSKLERPLLSSARTTSEPLTERAVRGATRTEEVEACLGKGRTVANMGDLESEMEAQFMTAGGKSRGSGLLRLRWVL